MLLLQAAAAEPATTGGVVTAVIGAALSFSGFVWKILREQAKERKETAEIHAKSIEALETARLEERREWRETLQEFSASLQAVIRDNTEAMKGQTKQNSELGVYLREARRAAIREMSTDEHGRALRRRSDDQHRGE